MSDTPVPSKEWRIAPGDPTCVFTGDIATPIKFFSKERAAMVVAAVNAYRAAPEPTTPASKEPVTLRHIAIIAHKTEYATEDRIEIIQKLLAAQSAHEPRAERTSSDYAIEHAEYFAQAVEAYRKARMSHDALLDAEESDADRLQPSAEALSDHWANVGSLMYEFRKRAERATAERAAQPPGASLRDLLKPIELDELIEWHKLCANCCERSDDFAGARRHRERRVELVGIRAGDAPTKGEAP